MLKVKIGRFGLLDALKFRNLPERRRKEIAKAEAKPVVWDYPINRKASALHPDALSMVVEKRLSHGSGGAVTYVLKTSDGTPAPYFRAGQYVVLSCGSVSRPYSLSSSPREALEGRYEVTVKDSPSGFFPKLLDKTLLEGARVKVSGPYGTFHHQKFRDGVHVVAVAGGSGITPFLSMAKAIDEGSEDFSLTILYGSRTEDSMLFGDELDRLSSEKVKVVHVLSHEEREGYLQGFITRDLIKEHLMEGDSLFVCGPEAMVSHIKDEIEPLGLPRRLVRVEVMGVPDAFAPKEGQRTFTLTVRQCGRIYRLPLRGDETILEALERGGVEAPSRCRGGECGWCRAQLLSGEVHVVEDNDSRRFEDRKTGVIHPCVTFPLSDIVLEVPGKY